LPQKHKTEKCLPNESKTWKELTRYKKTLDCNTQNTWGRIESEEQKNLTPNRILQCEKLIFQHSEYTPHTRKSILHDG